MRTRFSDSNQISEDETRQVHQLWQGNNRFLFGGRLMFGPGVKSVVLSLNSNSSSIVCSVHVEGAVTEFQQSLGNLIITMADYNDLEVIDESETEVIDKSEPEAVDEPDPEPPVLVEPHIIDETHSEVIDETELESEVKKSLIETLIDFPVEPTIKPTLTAISLRSLMFTTRCKSFYKRQVHRRLMP